MSDHLQDSVYSFVERAYMRLQAGDVLARCLEEGGISPIQEMIEGLVLSGPKNLASLREIFDETGQRKTQVQDDLHQVFAQFADVLKSYGVELGDEETAQSVQSWDTRQLIESMNQQGVYEADIQMACVRVWQDSRELMENLSAKLEIIEEIGLCLQDWLWGLAYQTIHYQTEAETPDRDEKPL